MHPHWRSCPRCGRPQARLMAAYAGQLTLVDDIVAATVATELQWSGAV